MALSWLNLNILGFLGIYNVDRAIAVENEDTFIYIIGLVICLKIVVNEQNVSILNIFDNDTEPISAGVTAIYEATTNATTEGNGINVADAMILYTVEKHTVAVTNHEQAKVAISAHLKDDMDSIYLKQISSSASIFQSYNKNGIAGQTGTLIYNGIYGRARLNSISSIKVELLNDKPVTATYIELHICIFHNHSWDITLDKMVSLENNNNLKDDTSAITKIDIAICFVVDEHLIVKDGAVFFLKINDIGEEEHFRKPLTGKAKEIASAER